MVDLRVKYDEYSNDITVEIKDVGTVTFTDEAKANEFIKDILVSNGMSY